MNPFYKFIFFITHQPQSLPSPQDTSLDNQNNLLNKESENENKNKQNCVFTSLDISNAILITTKPYIKEQINSSLQTQNDVYAFYCKHDSIYREFDEVYDLSNHRLELFYENHFQLYELNSNSLFLFTSYEGHSFANPLFTEFFHSFTDKLPSLINEFGLSKYDILINSFFLYNNCFYELLSKKSQSNETTLAIYNDILTKKNNKITELNCDENDISLVIIVQFTNEMEIYFLNAMNTYSKEREKIGKDNSLESKTIKDFLNDITYISDEKKAQYFKLDSIDKIFIISCVNDLFECFEKSKLNVELMYHLSKETKFHGVTTDRFGFDSIKSLDDDGTNSLSASFNPFSKVNNSMNKNLKNSLNILNTTNNLNNETIIGPDASLMSINELSTTNYDNNKLKSSKILSNSVMKGNNDAQINELFKSIEHLNGLIENKDNEELLKLKDDLSKITNMKIEMEINLKQMENELKLKSEENLTLNKKIQQKDNYITTLEKKLKDMKKTNEKELNQLKDELNNINRENKEMTNKIKAYDSKYLQLKANNEQMKLRVDNIQNTLMMLTQLNFPKK